MWPNLWRIVRELTHRQTNIRTDIKVKTEGPNNNCNAFLEFNWRINNIPLKIENTLYCTSIVKCWSAFRRRSFITFKMWLIIYRYNSTYPSWDKYDFTSWHYVICQLYNYLCDLLINIQIYVQLTLVQVFYDQMTNLIKLIWKIRLDKIIDNIT